MLSIDDRLLTIAEVAKFIRKPLSWVYENHSELGSVKVGQAVRIPEASLMAYLTRDAA